MQDKQGRDAVSIPVMREVAVHRDGGLWRPVLWKGRRRLTEMQAAKTCRYDVLSVFSEGSSTTPPPDLSSYNPVSASGFVSPDRLPFLASPTARFAPSHEAACGPDSLIPRNAPGRSAAWANPYLIMPTGKRPRAETRCVPVCRAAGPSAPTPPVHAVRKEHNHVQG